ncbi:MAG: hypothetical protein OXC66_15820 [Roseovarius sp.]|nr:hypothetical protein [Roseovarius sp.]
MGDGAARGGRTPNAGTSEETATTYSASRQRQSQLKQVDRRGLSVFLVVTTRVFWRN